MVRVGQRWHALRAKLLTMRIGPGAAFLPPNVTRIHMEFAYTIGDGHAGPKKFWRQMLPRLKYYNPAIPMIVNRKHNNEGAAVMSVYFSTGKNPLDRFALPQTPSSSIDQSKAPAPVDGERVIKIDMKYKRSEEILERFFAETEAEQIRATAEQDAEMAEVEALRIKSETDRQRNLEIRKEARKEKAMLDKARADVAAS